VNFLDNEDEELEKVLLISCRYFVQHAEQYNAGMLRTISAQLRIVKNRPPQAKDRAKGRETRGTIRRDTVLASLRLSATTFLGRLASTMNGGKAGGR
jgi:hypothetical protein